MISMMEEARQISALGGPDQHRLQICNDPGAVIVTIA
jgi:hypothetical protein